MMRQVILYPDSEGGGWVAEVPSLPGCISDGQTKDEAIANVREAISEWVASAEALGIDVPPDQLEVEVCVI